MANRNSHEIYYLGLDTGATKTHALIADASGNVRAFKQGSPGNPQSIGGYGALERLLTVLIQNTCQSAGIAANDIHAAGLGLAGFDWPFQGKSFYATARAAGLPEKTFIVNDAALGIYAGTTEGWGICVSAGTSFNCRGRTRDRREGRAIGDGLKWGEGAGALELSVKAAQMVIAQWLKTGPETLLTKLFMEQFGVPSLAELVEGIVLRRYPVTAELAPRIFEVAAQGDQATNDAVLWAAGRLAKLAVGAIRQLDLQDQAFEIVLSGSFFKAGDILISPMKEAVLSVAPLAEFKLLDMPPVCGGILLAMEQAGGLSQEKRGFVNKTMRIWFEGLMKQFNSP
ncbi:MAG TPA: BadF/BadG/BcrA/BcrD ATPase family protein [Pelolinea sp.]|nr:BadF/BadG/BcrA/BcrD ATPase family protein [Pelolinea sp.]